MTTPFTPEDELERLLQLLYQCPVGLITLDDARSIEMINPAAVRLLAPAARTEADPSDLLRVLEKLVPDFWELTDAEPDEVGRLHRGRRIVVPLGGSELIEVVLTEVDGRVMITVLDASIEPGLTVREHDIAIELSGAMLGRIDPVPGLPVSVVFQPAGEMAVSGDWFDVIDLTGDLVGFVVGDVIGHDLHAALAMGQLRSALRAMAVRRADPAGLLTRADEFGRRIDGAAGTSLVYGVLDRATGVLTYSCAGHPPPLLVRAGGPAQYLDGGRGPLLALPWSTTRTSATVVLQPGDSVVLYTDGLVDRRTTSLADGLDRIAGAAHALAGVPGMALGPALCKAVLGDVRAEDDVCVLTVRHEPVTTAAANLVTVSIDPRTGGR